MGRRWRSVCMGSPRGSAREYSKGAGAGKFPQDGQEDLADQQGVGADVEARAAPPQSLAGRAVLLSGGGQMAVGLDASQLEGRAVQAGVTEQLTAQGAVAEGVQVTQRPLHAAGRQHRARSEERRVGKEWEHG